MEDIEKEIEIYEKSVRQAQCKHELPKIAKVVPISANEMLGELICPKCGFFLGILTQKAKIQTASFNGGQIKSQKTDGE